LIDKCRVFPKKTCFWFSHNWKTGKANKPTKDLLPITGYVKCKFEKLPCKSFEAVAEIRFFWGGGGGATDKTFKFPTNPQFALERLFLALF
jgi:hypothetical protein